MEAYGFKQQKITNNKTEHSFQFPNNHLDLLKLLFDK